jgi:hypothetical protein
MVLQLQLLLLLLLRQRKLRVLPAAHLCQLCGTQPSAADCWLLRLLEEGVLPEDFQAGGGSGPAQASTSGRCQKEQQC